jgi:hypothetical protein
MLLKVSVGVDDDDGEIAMCWEVLNSDQGNNNSDE